MKTNDEIRVDRLKMLINECGGVSNFANKINRQYSQVSQWLNRSVDSKTGRRRSMSDDIARYVESVCSKPIGWMDQPVEIITPNVEELHKSDFGKVPLISWVQAGDWSEAIDNFAPGDAEAWIPCPACHSGRAFALRVRGISMYNPGGDFSFRDGDIIFIDPMRQPIHGSFVVAKMMDSNEVTFKKLIFEGNKKYLYALNPDWKDRIIEIDGNCVVCGVLIFGGRGY